MDIRLAQSNELERLTQLSKEAFDTDINVGNSEIGGPPEYDNVNWHKEMLKQKCLYSVFSETQLIGGALLFRDQKYSEIMYIGRIFVDPMLHRKHYGITMMNMLESMFSDIVYWKLDTPCWNIRTNQFYQKLGYHEVGRDDESVYYEKRIQRL